MAFFDNLGDQLSALGKKSYSKAKGLSDSARLSAMVSEEERTISDIYCQIGRLYAANHKADYEACFAELFAQLARAEEHILNYQQQLMELRGVQRCDRCGAEVPKGSQFCSACGAQVKPFVPAGCTLCPKCGAAVKNGMNFCTSCGCPMNAPVQRDDILTPPAWKPAVHSEPDVYPEPVSGEKAPYEPPVYPEPVSGADAPCEPPVYPEPASGEDAPCEPPVYTPAPQQDEPAPAAYPEPAVPHCPHCGAELEPDSVFCSECGQRV